MFKCASGAANLVLSCHAQIALLWLFWAPSLVFKSNSHYWKHLFCHELLPCTRIPSITWHTDFWRIKSIFYYCNRQLEEVKEKLFRFQKDIALRNSSLLSVSSFKAQAVWDSYLLVLTKIPPLLLWDVSVNASCCLLIPKLYIHFTTSGLCIHFCR